MLRLANRLHCGQNSIRYMHVSDFQFLWKIWQKIFNQNLFLCKMKKRGKIIAIRREDQSVWERRAPFAPHHVKRLVKSGINVLVQPSNRRAYPMQVRKII